MPSSAILAAFRVSLSPASREKSIKRATQPLPLWGQSSSVLAALFGGATGCTGAGGVLPGGFSTVVGVSGAGGLTGVVVPDGGLSVTVVGGGLSVVCGG